ncbi:hypothetical protein SETIT_1G260000v2 [Setaria italica]|uniref:Uncharacterized protein n=1 Tax=Setaria italica TaxID=4555 RepID=A0A368PPB6_SETIT|nr:hypothetical protein SETIT_1G260000v2 [Setaria italica]
MTLCGSSARWRYPSSSSTATTAGRWVPDCRLRRTETEDRNSGPIEAGCGAHKRRATAARIGGNGLTA